MKQFGFGDPNQLAAQLGIAVLLFFALLALAIIMLLYIRSEANKWEQREAQTKEIYQSIITQISSSQAKDFELLKESLEDNRDQISLIRSLVERTKTMQMQNDRAFQDIFKKLSHVLEDRCRNHYPKPVQQ
jgi:secreted Zn-dependent insulinase-like peptidase